MERETGFTLFELMIAIAVIAILSAAAVPAYQGYIQKAAFTDMLQTMSSYKTAVELCLLEQGSFQSCNSGQNGISSSKTTNYVSEVQVVKGVITLIGKNTLSGIIVDLTPSVDENSGDINWQRHCQGTQNESLLNACKDVFRFDEASL